MVAGIQSSRMNDQRAELPRYPGLNSQDVINQYLHNQPTEEPDDAFFEMLMRCQVNKDTIVIWHSALVVFYLSVNINMTCNDEMLPFQNVFGHPLFGHRSLQQHSIY
jgi:hypothetical protein